MSTQFTIHKPDNQHIQTKCLQYMLTEIDPKTVDYMELVFIIDPISKSIDIGYGSDDGCDLSNSYTTFSVLVDGSCIYNDCRTPYDVYAVIEMSNSKVFDDQTEITFKYVQGLSQQALTVRKTPVYDIKQGDYICTHNWYELHYVKDIFPDDYGVDTQFVIQTQHTQFSMHSYDIMNVVEIRALGG